MQYFRDTSDRHDLKDIIKSKCTQSCTQLGLGMKQINAPGSQHLDQAKRGRVRPRKDPNAGVQASKSDLPPTTLEVAGKDEEHICPLVQGKVEMQALTNMAHDTTGEYNTEKLRDKTIDKLAT